MPARTLRSAQHRILSVSMAVGLFCTAAFLFSAPVAHAADSNGQIPNFMGIAWQNLGGTAFKPVPGDTGPGPILQHPDYPYVNDQNKRIADTNNPILQPWVKERMDMEVARVIAGGIPFIPTSRCWPGGVPGLHTYTANVFYLQTEDQVWILQMRNEVRRIYLNVEHSEDPGYSWYGKSIGHYENGDTLVIETIGLDDKGPIDRLNTPHTRQLHVVERHTLMDNGQTLQVSFTVTDPGAFTMPWRAMMVLGPETILDENGVQLPVPWQERICSENVGDYHLTSTDLVPVPYDEIADF